MAERQAACIEDRRDPGSTAAHTGRHHPLPTVDDRGKPEDGNDATACASIRCSRWRSNGYRRFGTCVHSRPSHRIYARCCISAVLWSISIAGRCFRAHRKRWVCLATITSTLRHTANAPLALSRSYCKFPDTIILMLTQDRE